MKEFLFRVVLHLFDLVVKMICAKCFQCDACRNILSDFYEHCFDEPFESLSEDDVV